MTTNSRRDILAGAMAVTLAASAPSAAFARARNPAIPRWDIFELKLTGPSTGNPFRDVQLSAIFEQGGREIEVRGFYDGGGVFKIRFMPDATGDWRYVTRSSVAALNGKSGRLRCKTPRSGVHGPVGVRNTHHFGHADGTPFYPFGTTCYAWIHQSESLQQQTLKTLAASPFNKMRMCVFPKSYEYNNNEPALYPFERDAEGKSDFSRPNPAFYAHLEQRILDLQALGIETDLILFHPYDRWGYATMSADDDDQYLRYALARLSSIRSVWWSMANEYDFMRAKTVADFDRLFHIVERDDPYGHLRSIHYGKVPYDYGRTWVTHASLQTSSFTRTAEFLTEFRKPVVYDEVQYEGNLNRRWGNLSGQEMTWRFWRGVIGGAYVTHGETLLEDQEEYDESATPTLWWSHGGALRGSSPARISFLKALVADASYSPPAKAGFEGEPAPYYPNASTVGADGKAITSVLYFMDYHQPIWFEFPLPAGTFTAEIIDPWEMTISPLPGTLSGKVKLKLPGTPFKAVRLRRV